MELGRKQNFINMRKIVFLCTALFFVVHFSFSQTFTTGLKWDDNSYSKTERVSAFDGSSFAETGNKKSLKNFTPIPNNQGKAGSCVGQSVGYGGLTTMFAIEKGTTNKTSITNEAFSALYIYNQINRWGCDGGSTFQDAFNVLQTKGNIKFKEFEHNDKDNCQLNPSSKRYATTYKIESYDRLFDINDTKDDKVNTTRRSLLSNKPVLIGMQTTSEMRNSEIRKNSFYFKPSPYSPKTGGHAMVVVGFDDTKETFEILNSWGTDWGNKGYCYVSYSDYADYCKYGFIMKLKEKVEPNKPENVNLKGDFVFKSIEYKGGKIQKVTQPVSFKANHYELQNINWEIGSQFQVIANNISKDDYVYVFSIDSENNQFVHFPKNEKLNSHYFGFVESPIVPYKGAEIFIPTKTTALTKDKSGTDYLFVLFSEHKLDDNELKKDIIKLAESGQNIINNFYSIFSDKLIPQSSLNYSANSMGVNISSNTKGYIAPIILTVK